jgi:hypothetical protein
LISKCSLPDGQRSCSREHTLIRALTESAAGYGIYSPEHIERVLRSVYEVSETPRTSFGDSGRLLSGVASRDRAASAAAEDAPSPSPVGRGDQAP